MVIELYPKSGWKSESEYLVANDNEEEEDIQVEKEEQASSSQQQQQQQQQQSSSPESGNGMDENTNKVLSGRVVGILKRNWKTYCGSIEPVSEGTVVGYVGIMKVWR